jgi:hypothetical protein
VSYPARADRKAPGGQEGAQHLFRPDDKGRRGRPLLFRDRSEQAAPEVLPQLPYHNGLQDAELGDSPGRPHEHRRPRQRRRPQGLQPRRVELGQVGHQQAAGLVGLTRNDRSKISQDVLIRIE